MQSNLKNKKSTELEKIELSFAQKLRLNKNFIAGQKEFLERRVKPSPPVKFKWYRAKVSGKQWNKMFSLEGYTYLSNEGDWVWMAFMAVVPPEGCLEISDEEARMVDMHYKSKNLWPRPLEEIRK